MKKHNILLIGGTGYLGSHLSEYLTYYGFKVVVTGSTKKTGAKDLWISFEEKESYKSLIGLKFDLVIILASKLSSLGNISLDHPDLRINTICYANFLQFLVNENISNHIVYMSSMTVYGKDNNLPVNEEGSINPLSTYGLSKSIAEQLTSFYCEQNNIKGVILRLPGIYGGNRKGGFIYNTYRKLLNNEQVFIKTQGLGYWETMHIEDVCSIIKTFLHNYEWNKSIEVFNIGYGQEIDFYAVAYYIQKKINKGQIVIEEKSKGYIPFYLSNEKLKKILNLDIDFHKKLDQYLQDIKE